METNISLTGKVIKIHSDFLYVKSDNELYECKIRGRLKKEKTEVFTGDNVRIEEINTESKQAVITEVLERKSIMTRPSLANIDQIIVVTSLMQPELDLVQLNRYLSLAKLNNITAIICINKIDLDDKENNWPEKICEIYEPLGYTVIFTSALDGSGVDNFKKVLVGKVSAFAGLSGVGKSSLLNNICPNLNLRVKNVSSKTGRGVHTTRHTEILELCLGDTNETCHIADTPGFSCLKFDNIFPADVINLFDDIKEFAHDCYFSDCLHLEEKKCNVRENLDKIEETRYLSYKTFVNEALEYKNQMKVTSQKEEKRTKTIDTSKNKKTNLFKTSIKDREQSRKKSKQEFNNISNIEDLY